MTILLVQTFLLMLGAFLLGTSLACLIRRGFSGGREVAAGAVPSSLTRAASSAAPGPGVSSVDTDRFGRALAGGQGPAVPPVFHAGQPVVEVQPRPAEPAARAAPQPAPPQPSPPAPPQRDALPPGPATPLPKAEAAAPAARVAPAPEPKPSSSEPSYTQVALAAAAAAAAAAAKAKADAEAARKAAEDKEPAPQDDTARPTRFGTPVAATPLERSIGEAADDLTRIRGIDVELKERLVRYGVHRFSQIAAWTPDDVRAVSQTLGFQGRIERENWIEQAEVLASGGDPGVSRQRSAAPPLETVGPADGDRLHRIIGIDPASEALLRANGVTQLSHIAAWGAEDIARFEALLGAPGRVTAESWVEQARFLTGRAAPASEPEAAGSEAAAPDASSVAPEASVPPVAARGEGYTGLRSVRSEALRGEGPVGVTAGEIDDLKRIRGIGVLIEKKLNSLGITAYEQVANWTGADVDRISQLLDFKGRIERENWIEQARILASGGQTEFSRRADRGGSSA